MSSSERDLQSRLDEMEAEMKQQQVSNSQESQTKSIFSQVEINPSPQVKGWIDSGKAWFNTLPKIGKAAVAIGGVWLGFSALGAILHVVSSIISVGVIGLILYVGYRLFTNDSESN